MRRPRALPWLLLGEDFLMPEILHRCVEHVMGQGHDESTAYAICRASMNLAEDGSRDAQANSVSERDMLISAASEITKRQFANLPRLRKWMPICKAVGEYVNGDQEGELTLKRFRRIVSNYNEHPRQVPVYLLTGQPNPEHPEDLDARLADGWVEGLKIEGDWLMGDVVLNGNAALAVLQDGVRGASIGSVRGQAYDGKAIGEVLEHVVLTNQPFVKGMNIAATSRAQGGERVECHFTALPKREANMAEKSGKDASADTIAADHSANDEPTVASMKAQEQTILGLQAKVLQLEESNEELRDQLKSQPADVEKEELALRVKRLEMKTEAQEVRELVASGLQRGTLKPSWCKGYSEGKGKDKDTQTMRWFTASKFQGDLKLLAWAVENNQPMYSVGRTYNSGTPADMENPAAKLSDADKEMLAKHGISEEAFAAMRGEVRNVEDFKARFPNAKKE
jgi:hypothetical protein